MVARLNGCPRLRLPFDASGGSDSDQADRDVGLCLGNPELDGVTVDDKKDFVFSVKAF